VARIGSRISVVLIGRRIKVPAWTDVPGRLGEVTFLQLPPSHVQEVFGEFQRRGLMFLDGPLALALALPAVKAR
jgi:hypothetical protein